MSNYITRFSVGEVFIYVSGLQRIGVKGTFEVKQSSKNEFFLSWLPDSPNELDYSVFVSINEINYIKKFIPLLGSASIMVIRKDGISFPPFYFASSEMHSFFELLQQITILEQTSSSPETYLLHPLPQNFIISQHNISDHQLNSTSIANHNRDHNIYSNANLIDLNGSPICMNEGNFNSTSVNINNSPLNIFSNYSSDNNNQIDSNINNNCAQQSPISSVFPGFENIQKKFTQMTKRVTSMLPESISYPNIYNKIEESKPLPVSQLSPVSTSILIPSSLLSSSSAIPPSQPLTRTGFSLQEETNLGSFELLPFESENEKWAEMMTIQKKARSPMLSASFWRNSFDKEGRLRNYENICTIIYEGGVEKSIRREVWKYLLNYYPAQSSERERAIIDQEKKNEYAIYSQQWRSITAEQESHFSKFRAMKDNIRKDVLRTDRTLPYFIDENSPYLLSVNNILLSYCFFNFDIGYVQGMNDLIAVLIIVFEGNEVEAFGCFKCFIHRFMDNFKKKQIGIHNQLIRMKEILRYIEPELYHHFKNHAMLFCFRWLLIIFKREFTLDEIQNIWEVIWTNHFSSHHQLFICLAMLLTCRDRILQEQMTDDEIFQYLTMNPITASSNEILMEADCLYRKFSIVCDEETQNKIFQMTAKIA